MGYKVEILPTAWEDLKRIEDWYVLRFNTETAADVIESILCVIEKLEMFPEIGALTPDSCLDKYGYRMLICGRHIGIYRMVNDKVYIYHIADSRTDYAKLFEI